MEKVTRPSSARISSIMNAAKIGDEDCRALKLIPARQNSKRTSKTPKSGKAKPSITKTPICPIVLAKSQSRFAGKNGLVEKLDITSTPAQTPYALRSKIKQRLSKMTTEELSSEDENDSLSGSDQSSSSETECTPKGKKPPAKRSYSSKKSTSRAKRTTTFSMQTRAEDYFLSHESKRTLTSNNTLPNLQIPHFNRETLTGLLQNVTKSHKCQIDSMLAAYQEQFPKWLFQLSQGFNILLHGLGSKIPLLNAFHKYLDDEHTVVVVNGFFPSVTVKQILNSITENVLEHKADFKKPKDQVAFIRKTLRISDVGKLVLIINSIDGAMLRNERTQNILCNLAQCDDVYLLASIDHINAPLLWDQRKMNDFNWLWKDVTSFLPYTEETSYENSLLVRQTGALALSSLLHVFHSLTPNARGIFSLLAQYQLDHKDKINNYIGMSFQDCYQQCREAFLVNSELTLKAQLTEFKDHKLLKVKKGADGEHLMIPLDSSTISEFLLSLEKAT